TNGWLLYTVRPLTNQPPTADSGACRGTVYFYDSVDGSPDNSSAQPGKARIIIESIGGQLVSETLYAYPNAYTTYSQTMKDPDDPTWDFPGNETNLTVLDSQFRLIKAVNPDGTATYVEYTDTTSPTGRLTKTWTGAYSGTLGSSAFYA